MINTDKFRFCPACNERVAYWDARWRWNGKAWEHKCGDGQAGYVQAVPRYYKVQRPSDTHFIVTALEDLNSVIETELEILTGDEVITIRRVEMTEEEFDNLPEFEGQHPQEETQCKSYLSGGKKRSLRLNATPYPGLAKRSAFPNRE